MRRALLAVLLLLLAITAWRSRSHAELAPVPGVRDLDVDALIDLLPVAGWNGIASPHLDDFIRTLAVEELRRRLDSGASLTDDQWRNALVRSHAFRVRDRWPADLPFAVSMEVPDWLGDPTRIQAIPDRPDLSAAEVGFAFPTLCGTMFLRNSLHGRHHELGLLPPGHHALRFQMRIQRETTVLWEGTIDTDVEVAGETGDLLPRIEGDTLDEAVRDAVCVGTCYTWTREGRVAYVAVDPDVARFPELATTALSLSIDVCEGDVVHESLVVRASAYDPLYAANSLRSGPLHFFGERELESVPASLLDAPDDLERWTLRVRGVPGPLHRFWHADALWTGDLDIPLTEAVAREHELAGPRGRGPIVSTPRG